MSGHRNWNFYNFCASMMAFWVRFVKGLVSNRSAERRSLAYADCNSRTWLTSLSLEIARAKTGFVRSNGLMRPATFTRGLSQISQPLREADCREKSRFCRAITMRQMTR
jgi:hypothetical protein